MKHWEECNAPICKESIEKDFKQILVWYPGEQVCMKTPYSKFQKKQIDINKWVAKRRFKNIDECYTAHDLETRSI